MTTKGFVAAHAKGATFERGLRSIYEYRDLGIKQATEGRVDALVIRAAAGKEFSSQPHIHKSTPKNRVRTSNSTNRANLNDINNIAP